MNTTLQTGNNRVGYVDWNVRDFHGFNTERGVTYNAYLIQDDNSGLIDTEKKLYAKELLKNISALLELSDIKYIVYNQAELYHSGALPIIMKAIPNAMLVCNKKCKMTLSQHYNISKWNFHIVPAGDTISFGKRTLHFIETARMSFHHYNRLNRFSL